MATPKKDKPKRRGRKKTSTVKSIKDTLKNDDKLSRQYRWQLNKLASGKCSCCSTPLSDDSGIYCVKCLEHRRKLARDRYRKRNGIPLDAPLNTKKPKTSNTTEP